MRIFNRPAFFILLIRRTIFGILPFMLLLFIIIGLFTNTFYVLNVEHEFANPTKDVALYPNDSKRSLTNSLRHTYLLSLGDFTVDGYSTNLVWW